MSEKEIALKQIVPPTPFDHVLNWLRLKSAYGVTQAEYCEAAGISKPTLLKYIKQCSVEVLRHLEEGS
ncbi:hypothetical protein [Vagococcus salmoninarum]|uniref:hypothetical protein n=1 Tax=Vagococcus salmoninarum TaxID=2739 RepID=UPI003F95CAFD